MLTICLLLQLEGDDFLDVVNPCTKKGDCSTKGFKHEKLAAWRDIAADEKGYFRCDVPFVRPSKPIVLFAISDGRQQTVSK